MTETLDLHDLLPVIPEIVLIVGGMALLMVGAFRGERTAGTIDWLAILLLYPAAGRWLGE